MPHKDMSGVAYSCYMYVAILSKSQRIKKPSKGGPLFTGLQKLKYGTRTFCTEDFCDYGIGFGVFV
jgi:hypothetical protein